ncbi:MAG: DUF1223 domain-containing protein [Gammaproteobacteria bacterium]|nr:DUF1223 domain-containing protein [Gammaproteobacteria bacterium]
MTIKFSINLLLFALCWISVIGQTDQSLLVSSANTITPVVELYTSEGCSSCPPADRFLAELGAHIGPDFHAVPLAFHVDYWNRLGWPDPYSKKQFTERQRWVAHINRQLSIYTPELVVSGQEARNGALIYDRIRKHNETVANVAIQLQVERRVPERLHAEITFDNSSESLAEGYIAIYENGITREIGAGENRGATLYHEFLVRYWSQPSTVDIGQSKIHAVIDIEPDWEFSNLGLAVVATEPKTGRTLQAVNTPLRSLY